MFWAIQQLFNRDDKLRQEGSDRRDDELARQAREFGFIDIGGMRIHVPSEQSGQSSAPFAGMEQPESNLDPNEPVALGARVAVGAEGIYYVGRTSEIDPQMASPIPIGKPLVGMVVVDANGKVHVLPISGEAKNPVGFRTPADDRRVIEHQGFRPPQSLQELIDQMYPARQD